MHSTISPKDVVALTSELTLLYVEDDKTLQQQSFSLFKRFFKEVVLADDGEIALERYASMPFDLIITDIEMPNINGIEMTKQILAINPDQAVIVLSAYENDSNITSFKSMGIFDFITKPLDMDSMLMVFFDVATRLSNKHSLQKTQEETSIDMVELNELFSEIDGLIISICLNHEYDQVELHREYLGKLFVRYGSILSTYHTYTALSQKVSELGNVIADTPLSNDIEHTKYTFTLLESFLSVLNKWHESWDSSSLDIHFFDASILNDIETIIKAWLNEEENLITDIEFF